MDLKSLLIRLIILFLSSVLILFCRNQTHVQESRKSVADLDQIRERGKLIAITDFNSTNYFIYRGQPMGYQYELLQELADHLEIRLDVVVSNNLDETFDCLINGECDLIAINLTITKDRRKLMEFTEPHSQTKQVLIQQKPNNWRELGKAELEERLIRNQLELAGKIIYVQQNSSYSARLKNLSDEIGESIHIKEVPGDAEQLITLVAQGEIDYTVCDENVALVNQTYYPDIDVSTAISFPQNLAWAVNKESQQLLNEINSWLVAFKKSAKYRIIYNKYFRNQRSARMVQSDYYSLSSGKISPYDDFIRKYSQEIEWDWRLLASLIYQESRFDPRARSWAGAFGLMQLMPTTAQRFGVNFSSPPERQIKAGTEFIKWLNDQLQDQIKNEEERIKFILASYNVGTGHIYDAMNLARKNGEDPTIWENSVEEFLLKKSIPEYYRDPVVKYGYCRSIETYNYVREVIERYEHYKNIITEEGRPIS